jgi:hypothetical protein
MNATSGVDTITFAVTGTINLSGPLPDLATSVTLAGPGFHQLTVRRGTNDDYRIFTLTGTPTIIISGLTVANGSAIDGGGIYMAGGNLTITDSILSNNAARGNRWIQPDGSGYGRGGGLYVAGGAVSINTSTLSNNTAVGSPGYEGEICWDMGWDGGPGDVGLGGGLYVAGGGVSIDNSTLSGNQAVGGDGGLFCNCSRCWVAYDGGAGAGGGVYMSGGTLTVFQSTLSANRSTGGTGGRGRGNAVGGGLVSGGNVEIQFSTLAMNESSGTEGVAGGLFSAGTLLTRDTIVAGNAASTMAPDVYGDLGSRGHNLVGNTTDGSGFDPTDILNVDPMLGPLQDNGGPTFTHALLPGSPAIDAGDNTDAPEFDQRGEGFPRIVNGIIDIGALEVQGGLGMRHEQAMTSAWRRTSAPQTTVAR